MNIEIQMDNKNDFLLKLKERVKHRYHGRENEVYRCVNRNFLCINGELNNENEVDMVIALNNHDLRGIPARDRFSFIKRIIMRFFRLYTNRQTLFNLALLAKVIRMEDKNEDLYEQIEIISRQIADLEIKLAEHNK